MDDKEEYADPRDFSWAVIGKKKGRIVLPPLGRTEESEMLYLDQVLLECQHVAKEKGIEVKTWHAKTQGEMWGSRETYEMLMKEAMRRIALRKGHPDPFPGE